MNARYEKITQLCYYLLVVEIILMVIKYNDGPLLPFSIMKVVLIITAIALVISVLLFYSKRKKVH